MSHCDACPVLWSWAKKINHENVFNAEAMANNLLSFLELCKAVAEWEKERREAKAASRGKEAV